MRDMPRVAAISPGPLLSPKSQRLETLPNSAWLLLQPRNRRAHPCGLWAFDHLEDDQDSAEVLDGAARLTEGSMGFAEIAERPALTEPVVGLPRDDEVLLVVLYGAVGLA
jgi:hypothetical protein